MPDDFRRLLEGRACRALLVQELWRYGALADPANVLFVQTEHGAWARCFFDDGAFVWAELAPTPVESGTPAWELRLVDLGARFALSGQVVRRVRFTQPDPGDARLHLEFDAGVLVLDERAGHRRIAFARRNAWTP